MITGEVRGLAWVVLVLGLVVGLVTVACGSTASPEVGAGSDGTPDPVLLAGRTIFVDRCSSCHGASGGGTRSGPRLNRGRLAQEYPDPDDAATVVLEGRNRMPPFGGLLTTDDVDAVLRYVREVLGGS